MKLAPDQIVSEKHYQGALFANRIDIATDENKAKRVWNALEKKVKHQNCQKIYRVFLSEKEKVEMILLQYIDQVMRSNGGSIENFGDTNVMQVEDLHKKVSREAHRAIMFVRFQQIKDGKYFALFDPKYNVLPLTTDHFKDRYADQEWIIYDTRRKYGFYYNLKTVEEITFDPRAVNCKTGKIDASLLSDDETFFQQMWKDYYKTIAIEERKNLKVQMQFMPKRFWKYLPEKAV